MSCKVQGKVRETVKVTTVREDGTEIENYEEQIVTEIKTFHGSGSEVLVPNSFLREFDSSDISVECEASRRKSLTGGFGGKLSVSYKSKRKDYNLR